ncbi:MAG: hypothetical protein P4L92_16730 [Rudaea sp.]|nr:hypothetical protein [Rudaea sp.]
MHSIALRRFLLLAACVVSLPVLAGVGATSSGVSTTLPTTGTNPSASVQDQSAGFVQQNQQLQNASAQNGIAMPAGTPGATSTGANGTVTTAPAAKSGEPSRPGDPAAQAAAPATPAPPPAPPPTYVSVVKHLGKPGTPDTETAAAAPLVVPIAQTPAPVEPPKADPPPPAAQVPTPAPVPAPQAPVANTHANAADARPPANRIAPPVVTGGSGEAPDGITFYIGLGIAFLLLGVALTAYLRAQRDEATHHAPGG